MRQKFKLLFTLFLLCSLLLPVGTASALTNYVQDPSFEASYGSTAIWQQFSATSDTPLCKSTVAPDCSPIVGVSGPRTGTVWGWFGGLDWADSGPGSSEIARLSQSVTFPNSCGAQ